MYYSAKNAIRFISKIGYRDHTTSHFKAMNILKLNDLLKLQICACLYTTVYHKYDNKLKNQITMQSNTHSHYTRVNNFTINRLIEVNHCVTYYTEG